MMDRSFQVPNVDSECDTTRVFAEYERLRKRLYLVWSVPVRDMSAIFEVMTQLGETRAAYKAACKRRQDMSVAGDKWAAR